MERRSVEIFEQEEDDLTALYYLFRDSVHELYKYDKRKLSWLAYSTLHCMKDDRLDDEDCYYQNVKANSHTTDERISLFKPLHRRLQWNRYTDMICCITQVSLNIPLIKSSSDLPPQRSFGWISSGDVLYPRCVIKDLAKAIHQPFSLQHIAAAQSISKLKNYANYAPEILLHVYNVTKTNQTLYVRAGEDTKRKVYMYANVVKNFIYKEMFKPLVAQQYFDNLELRPKPCCMKCGLIRKIEISECFCMLCNFLRYAMVYTPKFEKSFHTNHQ